VDGVGRNEAGMRGCRAKDDCPTTFFMRTGGIDVGADLLVFQKNSRKPSQSQREQLFLQLIKETDGAGHTTEPMNRLFTLPNRGYTKKADE